MSTNDYTQYINVNIYPDLKGKFFFQDESQKDNYINNSYQPSALNTADGYEEVQFHTTLLNEALTTIANDTLNHQNIFQSTGKTLANCCSALGKIMPKNINIDDHSRHTEFNVNSKNTTISQTTVNDGQEAKKKEKTTEKEEDKKEDNSNMVKLGVMFAIGAIAGIALAAYEYAILQDTIEEQSNLKSLCLKWNEKKADYYQTDSKFVKNEDVAVKAGAGILNQRHYNRKLGTIQRTILAVSSVIGLVGVIAGSAVVAKVALIAVAVTVVSIAGRYVYECVRQKAQNKLADQILENLKKNAADKKNEAYAMPAANEVPKEWFTFTQESYKNESAPKWEQQFGNPSAPSAPPLEEEFA